jgi:hypothetical protein
MSWNCHIADMAAARRFTLATSADYFVGDGWQSAGTPTPMLGLQRGNGGDQNVIGLRGVFALRSPLDFGTLIEFTS